MLQEIFSLIDVALEQKMRTQHKADRIDLDQYYTPYCEGRMTLPKLAPYHGDLPERLVTFTEARALYNKGEKPDGCICHYIDDKRFQCVYRNPAEYLPMYRKKKASAVSTRTHISYACGHTNNLRGIIGVLKTLN